MAKTATDNTKSVQRDQQVLAILEENGLTSVHELCEKLYLSEATVRRCLSSLARKGLIHRTHGGAELLKTFTNAGPFSSRIHQNAAAKRSIAQKAAALVPNGSIVFQDQSSTCLHLAEALKDKQDLTVVTNNIAIASLLSTTNFEVHLSGGYLCDKARVCLVGADSHQIFLNICADFVFFSTHSLSSDALPRIATGRRSMSETLCSKMPSARFFCATAPSLTALPALSSAPYRIWICLSVRNTLQKLMPTVFRA